MKFFKFTIVAGVFVGCATVLVNAKANEECAQIKQIIDSGLNRQYPFAAVAGLNLPNADCWTDIGDRDSKRNFYSCEWNADNYSKLDELKNERGELSDARGELFEAWIEHDGGLYAWEKAEALQLEANELIQTYNYAISNIVITTQAQQALLMEWQSEIQQLQRQAQSAQNNAQALDREHDELLAKYDAKIKESEDKIQETEALEKNLEILANQQADALYTGLYECISSGAIGNYAYQVDSQRKEWNLANDCFVGISDSGPTLYISCPNPSYQVQ